MIPAATRQMLTELTTRLDIATAMMSQVARNFHDWAPGYPSSVIGARPASGSSSEPDGLNGVERAAVSRDEIADAAKRITKLVNQLTTPITTLYGLAELWGKATTEGAINPLGEDDDWCDSCARIHQMTPRHRGVLCRWCYDFQSLQGWLPSPSLLDAHWQGKRMTTAMVDADHPAKRRHSRRVA